MVWNTDSILKLTDGQFESSKIKVKSAKLWNPDFVGKTILWQASNMLLVIQWESERKD